MTSRVAALEKERDETAKRESDTRKRARDINSKLRKAEEEMETLADRASTLEQDLASEQASSRKLQDRLTAAEAAAQEARQDAEREKKILESSFQQRLEEEKQKWRQDLQPQPSPLEHNYLRADSPSTMNRRHSPDPLSMLNRRPMPRGFSSDNPLSPMDRMLLDDRRPSSIQTNAKAHNNLRSPEVGAPHRQDSFPWSLSGLKGLSTSVSATPSMHAYDTEEIGRAHV